MIDRDGKILKGKSDSGRWHDGMVPWGCKLYNPHTKRTVIGWNQYKKEMASAEKSKCNRNFNDRWK